MLCWYLEKELSGQSKGPEARLHLAVRGSTGAGVGLRGSGRVQGKALGLG